MGAGGFLNLTEIPETLFYPDYPKWDWNGRSVALQLYGAVPVELALEARSEVSGASWRK